MAVPWELMLSTHLMFFPYRILSYYPFWNRLRFSRKTTLALMIGSEIGVRLFLGFVALYGGNTRIAEFIVIPVCAVIYFSCVRLALSQLVFFYLFVTDHLLIIRGLTAFLLAHLLPGTELFTWQGGLLHTAVFLVTLPLILLFWRSTVNRMLEARSPNLWRTIWIIPLFTTVIIQLYTYDISPSAAGSFQFLFSRVGLFVCMVVIYYVLLRSLDTLRAQATLEEQARASTQLLMLQRNQYELLRQWIEETRAARHDLRQHLKLIQSYLESGDKEVLADYVAAYRQTLPKDTTEIYCLNPAVNTIVTYYGEMARERGISFDTMLDLPPQLFVLEPDFCVVTGNLLENALEALQEGEPKAFIKIRARIKDEKELILTVDNGPVPKPLTKDGQFYSSKHEGPGIGTSSIKRIATYYNGVADFQWKNGIFYASVFLRPATKKKVPAEEKSFPLTQ